MKLAVFLFICLLATSCNKKDLSTKYCTLWSTVEWSIQNKTTAENPFDLLATAEFQHSETGKIVRTQLFYSGGSSIWQFRFTATETGWWKFKVVSVNEKLNAWSGEVLVSENPDKNAHGFIKNLNGKWGWQGEEKAFVPQYVMAKKLEYYYDFENERVDSLRIDTEIEEFIVGHGFTGFHLLIGKSWFNIMGNPHFENPDSRSYEVLETIITKIHNLGGACHLWMWGSDGSRDKMDGEGPRGIVGEAGNEADLRNLRYLAARLGPLPGWSIGYGIDTENAVATIVQLNNWKNYLEKTMGWKHFIGARVGYDEKGLWALRPPGPRPEHDENFCSEINDEHCFWLNGDYIGYTSYRPLYERYRKTLSHQAQKPSFEEDRFRLRNRPNWEYKDYNEELTRRGLWHSAMAGGVANIWGNLLPKSEHTGSNPYQNKKQIKCYSQFFENRFLKTFESTKIENQMYLVSTKRKCAIIYAENVEEIDFSELEKLHEPICIVDTKIEYKEIPVILNDSLKWKTPYQSDWSVAIGTFKNNKQ